MRYVTITNSRFYNNAAGLIPNALDSEKFPPAEDNIIRGNEIFWNNFDFHKGAPFKIREDGTATLAPVGTGVLLLGGPRATSSRTTEIYGNWDVGVALIEGILLEENPQARDLIGNIVRDNAFGLGGTDLNGRELAYDGNGSGNCFGGNIGVSVTIPADGSTLTPCDPRRHERVQPRPRWRDARAGRRGERRRVAAPPARAQAGLHAARALHEVMRRRTAIAVAAVVALSGAAPAVAAAPKPQAGRGRRQLLPARRADGQAGHGRQVEVAGRRADRRARRQAQVRAQGREEVAVRARVERLHVQAARSRRPAPTRSSARSTRR